MNDLNIHNFDIDYGDVSEEVSTRLWALVLACKLNSTDLISTSLSTSVSPARGNAQLNTTQRTTAH